MSRLLFRHATAAGLTGLLLIGIFAAMVISFRADLRSEIHQKIIERDAAVLYPMARQQLADSEGAGDNADSATAPLTALLKSARQEGMLAIAVFDHEGNTLEAVPATQLFVELPMDDFWRLQSGQPITRYHPAFPLDQYFTGIARDQRPAPVLEVLLPLPGAGSPTPRYFVRYYIDARPLARELAVIDARIDRQTAVTLLIGAALVGLVLTAATIAVQRAQRVVAEHNERLTRANFELTLAAKASALGQITSHLIHGMQGPVEGLRAAVASREADPSSPVWETAAGYAERLQAMVRETVALLGDTRANASYELAAGELAAIIRDRNLPAAAERGIAFAVENESAWMIDSHRGSMLCLIVSNLVQNAIAATPAGRRVTVSLAPNPGAIVLTVCDEGPGIPENIRAHLFEPGRSGRPGGSGLGLAISRLLARQIGATITLVSTGPEGTRFDVTLPDRA